MKQRSPRWFFFFFLGMAPLVAFGWIGGLYLFAQATLTPVPGPDNSIEPSVFLYDEELPFKIYTSNIQKIAQARAAGELEPDFASVTEVSCDQHTVFLKELWTHQGKPLAYRITAERRTPSHRYSERGFEGVPERKTETAYYEIPSGVLFAYSMVSNTPSKPPVNIVFDGYRSQVDVSNGWKNPPPDRIHFSPIPLSFHRPQEDFKTRVCPVEMPNQRGL